METIVWLGFVLAALPATGKVVVSKAGESVSLSCTIASSTENQAWYHGSPKEQIFYTSSKSGVTRKGPAAVNLRSRVRHDGGLSISKVMREDAGEFTCEAGGHSEKHTLLVVTVSASPSDTLQAGSTASLQCEVNGLAKGDGVQWRSPNNATHPGTYSLTPVALSDTGAWTCMFSYNGQQYSVKLVVKVEGPPPTTPTTTTQGRENNRKPTCSNCGSDQIGQFSWWLKAAIGGGCLFVLLLVALVLVLCRRIRRKKRMRNRQPLTPKQYCQCNRPTAARKPQQGRKKGKPSALPLQPQLK